MQIDFLVNHPQHLPLLAEWQHAMWGHLDPTATLAGRIARLASHVGRPAIPTTIIAFDGEVLFGATSIVENDLRTHPHLSPLSPVSTLVNPIVGAALLPPWWSG